MLKSIDLSLSSSCGGDCLFCPSNKGERIKQKFMSIELVKKIVDEVASKDFLEKHQVKQFSVGENGDAFLNKDIIEILRYIKLKLPGIKTILFTNFQNFSKEKAQIILNEKLLDHIICNIDGSNERNYFLVKRMDYNITKKNLLGFLEIRKELKSDVNLDIYVITLNRYIKTIRRNFGFYPSKLQEKRYRKIKDDFETIENQWEKVLDCKKDRISRQSIIGWAERDKMNGKKINYKAYTCPVSWKDRAFIAPDGSWYACCYDSNNELVLGNVALESIEAVYNGQKRQNLIELLEKKEFYKIDGPCRTVPYCQTLPLRPKLKSNLAKFIGPNLTSRIKMLYSKSAFLKSLLDKFDESLYL